MNGSRIKKINITVSEPEENNVTEEEEDEGWPYVLWIALIGAFATIIAALINAYFR